MSRLLATALSSGLFLAACGPTQETPVTTETNSETSEAIDTSDADTSVETPNPTPTPVDSNGIETVGYPDGWEVQPFWSGEYPNAFAVTEEGVTVMGHAAITYQVYPPIYCGLPHKATYSPWNVARRESDDLDFVAMVFPTTFTIKEDTRVEVFVGDGAEMLDLSAGDQLIYKSYLAEGFFIAEKDGIQYELNEAELPQSTEFEQGPEDQEWVLVTCDDAEKTRAWVLFDDALNAQGVERYEHTGFGEAADLP